MILAFPRDLDRASLGGFLVRENDGRYRVDTADPHLMAELCTAIVELNEVEAHERQQRALARRAWQEQESRLLAIWQQQQQEARRREEERQRAIADQERKRAAERYVWMHGSVLEVGRRFGRGDLVIAHLVGRFSRREIVRELRVGEHRVSRIWRNLSEYPDCEDPPAESDPSI